MFMSIAQFHEDAQTIAIKVPINIHQATILCE